MEGADKLMKIITQYLDREMVELDEEHGMGRIEHSANKRRTRSDGIQEMAACLPKSLADIPSDPGLSFRVSQTGNLQWLSLAWSLRTQTILGQATLQLTRGHSLGDADMVEMVGPLKWTA